MKGKFVSTFLVLTMAASMLSACGNASSNASTPPPQLLRLKPFRNLFRNLIPYLHPMQRI